MKHAKELVESLRNVLGNADPVFPAIVKAVDKNNNTCDVEFNEMELGEVRLQATIKQNSIGFKIYPAVDSVVLVQRLGNKGELFIIMYSEVEEVLIQVDTTVLDIKNGFVIKKGNESLKKLMNDLIAEVKKIVVPTNVGPSGTPLNNAAFDAINTRVNNLLK